MVEITPRFAQQLELPRGKGDREAPEFHLAMEESKLSGPALDSHLDPTASGKAPFGGLPQSQFFYADANGAGTTGTPARAWYGRCHLNHQTHIRSSITSLKRFSRQSESSMQLRRDFAERRRRVRAACKVIEQHDEVLPDST